MPVVVCSCGRVMDPLVAICPACGRSTSGSTGTIAEDPTTLPRVNDTIPETRSGATGVSATLDDSVSSRPSWPSLAAPSEILNPTGTVHPSAFDPSTGTLAVPTPSEVSEQTGATLGLNSSVAESPTKTVAPSGSVGIGHTAASSTLADESPSQPATVIRDESGTGTLAGDATAAPSASSTRSGFPGGLNYEILSELGRGAMGVVYRARQKGLNRLVALKMILAGGMAGRAELARFQAEAEAVAAIDHPNIVKIFEVGALDGKPYFSLEFVSGGSLDGRVGETPQDAAQSARLVAQVARGMAYAHRRGIVHRDLKPANILLALPEGADPTRVPLGDCLPKVSDFGLVKKIDDDSSRTRDGAIMGTPSYMAPEQAMGLNKEVGPAADIHALGGILYDLLTGSPPFRGSTVMETIQQVIHREPPSPRMVLESVPRDLATICMKCLEKNPQKRYATADLLADDLDRYLRGEPVLARPAPWTERVAKWARRKPAQAALAASGAVITLLLAGSGFMLARFEAEKRQMAQAEAQRQEQEAQTQKRLRERADELRQLAEQRRAQAQANFQQACQAVDSLLDRIGGARLAHEPRLELLRKELLGEAAQFYRRFNDQSAGDDPAIGLQQASILRHLAGIASLMGDKREAENHLRTALARLLSGEPAEAGGRWIDETIETRQALGEILVERRALAEARSMLEQAISLAARHPGRVRAEVAQVKLDAAELEKLDGKPAKAAELLDSAIGDLSLRADDPAATARAQANLRLGNALVARARLAVEAGDRAKAESLLDQSVGRAEKLLEGSPKLPEGRVLLSAALVARADLNRDEAPGKAKSDMDRASDTLENLVTDFPATPEYRQQQAALLVSLANFHLAQGDPAQAEATLDRALSVREDLTRRVPWVPEYDRQLAGALNDRGLLFQTARRLDRAEKSYLESEKKLRALVAAHPGASDYRQELAKTLLNLAALRIQQKQPQTAGPLSDEAISLLAGLVERFPQEPARRVELARGMANAAVNAQLAGTPAKAIELDQKALEALAGARRQEDSADISYLMATTGSHLADLIDERDGISKALPVYEAALSELRNLAKSAASRPEFVRRLVEELNEIGFRLARAESLEKARALWLESLEVMRSRKETDPADNLADPASRLAANLTAMAQLEHGKGRFDDAHALLGKALELRRDRLPSHPSAAVGALELARAELLESAWREERNKKREALAAVLRASVHAARGLSSSADADAAVKAGLAQAAGECAKALATAKDNPESQGRLSSLARAALDGGNRQASLSIIESAMNAGRLDDGWEWLTLLDKAGFTDAAWMRRVIATDPPAGPRRELRERWLKNQ